MGNKIFLRQPVIEPQGEAKSALWIYKQLGEQLGLGDLLSIQGRGRLYSPTVSAPWSEFWNLNPKATLNFPLPKKAGF